MIREKTSEDTTRISEIWLETSIRAHAFVPESFWRADFKEMSEVLLPKARGLVHETDGVVDGFVTFGEGEIYCLFVDPESQGNGIGSLLLRHVQSMFESIELTVYEQNPRAQQFYERNGFVEVSVALCQYTGAPEVLMVWNQGESSPSPPDDKL